MVSVRPLLAALLQLAVSLAPVQPMTSYTQVNHDEPTNSVKETTITSDQEELRVPGVGEKDLLWDHVGDLTQHFVLGGEDRSTPKDFEDANTTATLVNQIEISINATNLFSSDPNSVSTKGTEQKEYVLGEIATQSVVTPHVLTTTDIGVGKPEVGDRPNRVDIEGKVILYPHERTVRKHSTNFMNITKQIRKSLKSIRTKFGKRKPQKIIYDTSDPFSVIFDEVKTQFRTNKSINISRENIIGGLGIRKLEELLKKEDKEESLYIQDSRTKTLKSFKLQTFQEEKDQFGSEQEEDEMKHNGLLEFGKIKSSPNEKIFFSKYDVDSNTSQENGDLEKFNDDGKDNLFKEWDNVSEEQEKLLEDMGLHDDNHVDGSTRDALTSPGRWFILLLAGNSTIVKLRQKDFAKYLKLNLAARLSLEYDEVKVNGVVLAPPRLMVNVSVIPANEGNNQDLDEEIDLEDKLFGEEEAPLHRLAETNATLLELSGEEYHVVRFLSLRSQKPIELEDASAATSTIVSDRHMDIENIIFIYIGGTSAIIFFVTLLWVLYRIIKLISLKQSVLCNGSNFFVAKWSCHGHQRMGDEQTPSIGGPLTVIYSGNFVDRTAPSSGSWIEDYRPSSVAEPLEAARQQPLYGFGALSNTALPEICEPHANTIQDSPRFALDSKLRILGCRPNHYLLPHQPARTSNDNKTTLDVRIHGAGVDNPNYQS